MAWLAAMMGGSGAAAEFGDRYPIRAAFAACLRLSCDRRKYQVESENRREPDPPHAHLGRDGWRESPSPF
jgi:hypothetical protein